MKTLHLNLKKKWFDMIASGVKTEEYRDIRAYWTCRLISFREETENAIIQELTDDLRNDKRRHKDIEECLKFFEVKISNYDTVIFRNGYAKDAPKMEFYINEITVGKGNLLWGAPEEDVFIIKLGERIR